MAEENSAVYESYWKIQGYFWKILPYFTAAFHGVLILI